MMDHVPTKQLQALLRAIVDNPEDERARRDRTSSEKLKNR